MRHPKAIAQLKQAAGIAQTQSLMLGWPNTLPPDLDAAILLTDLPAEAERQRPDLHALLAAAARAKSEADRARAARWPSLMLAANVGRTLFLVDERSPSNTYNLEVMLAVPLFDGGRLAAEARAAERFAAAADAQQQIVALETVQHLNEVHYAQSTRAGITLQFDSADESARAAEARYKAGFGSHAIVEASLVRPRPIMMTTCAAIVATLPIAIGFGTGGEARRPLGIAVVAGLMFSQYLITLYITPTLYVIMAQFEARLARQAGSK